MSFLNVETREFKIETDIKGIIDYTCSSLLFFSSSILSLVSGSPWMSSSDWSWAFSIALILWPSSFSFPSVSSTMHSKGWHKWKGGRGSASGPRPTEVGMPGWSAACLCLDMPGFEAQKSKLWIMIIYQYNNKNWEESSWFAYWSLQHEHNGARTTINYLYWRQVGV